MQKKKWTNRKINSISRVITSTFIVCMSLAVTLCGCTKSAQNSKESIWDCSVICAELSTENSYVITYCEEEMISRTGILTFQNQNDFPISVYLSSDEEERTETIEAGGNVSFFQIDKEKTYTVGIHAAVDEGTEIKVKAYDGERSEVY